MHFGTGAGKLVAMTVPAVLSDIILLSATDA